ncbi:MAG TPA: hypothetical protein VEB22_15590 [Phycisphaerales bacterium]|nr:hypothetical protein [Phycisphaerales bacterium]
MVTAADRLVALVLHSLRSLDEGALDAIAALGPDFTATEWARRLGCERADVIRAAGLLQVGLAPEIPSIMDVRQATEIVRMARATLRARNTRRAAQRSDEEVARAAG